MSSRQFLLSQDGLFCLSSHQHIKQPQNSNLIDKLRFYASKCFIARNSYWEDVVSYPTANIIEVYKIISAELTNISPIKGHTYAYIVNLSDNRATVLYCCYSEEIVSAAKSNKLWRLIPESLPYYRYLFNKHGIYFSSIDLSAYPNLKKLPLDSNDKSQSVSELLIKVDGDGDGLSSLPVNKNSMDMFSSAMMAESSALEKNKIQQVFNKFNPLNIVDLGGQIVEQVTLLTKKKGHLTSYVAIVLLASTLTFMVGKSLFLSWHQNHLSQLIAESKVTATKSLKLSNELKNIKSDMNNINAHLAAHQPKTQLLRVLIDLVNDDNKLKFVIIDISPSQMQIRGTITNAASLLSSLSKIKGFSQVAFNTPPATLKKGGEGFNIQLHFDNTINQYKTQELAL